MLFNCIQCGKMISSRKEVCPYCNKDVSAVAEELLKTQKAPFLQKKTQTKQFKEKHKGTILSFMIR